MDRSYNIVPEASSVIPAHAWSERLQGGVQKSDQFRASHFGIKEPVVKKYLQDPVS